MTNIERAKMVATILHCRQTYDDKDYTAHLEDVFNIVDKLQTVNEDMRVAAWLHDAVEDTQMKLKHVKEYFGEGVADIVYCLTDELGANRTERQLKTYPKIRGSAKATVVKLADRLANVRSAARNKNYGFLEMYKKEWPIFKKILIESVQFSEATNYDIQKLVHEIENIFDAARQVGI